MREHSEALNLAIQIADSRRTSARVYDALRIAGAAYLLYLAWQALKPGGRSPLQVRDLSVESRR